LLSEQIKDVLAFEDCKMLFSLYETSTSGSATIFRPRYIQAYITEVLVHLGRDNPTPAIELLKNSEGGTKYTTAQRQSVIDGLDVMLKRKAAAEAKAQEEHFKQKAEGDARSRGTETKVRFRFMTPSSTRPLPVASSPEHLLFSVFFLAKE
jgi:hypothetical protein